MTDFDVNDFVRQFGANYPRWLQDSLGSQLKAMNSQLERISRVSEGFNKTVKASEKEKTHLKNTFAAYRKATETLHEQQKKSLVLGKEKEKTDKKLKAAEKEYEKQVREADRHLKDLADGMQVSPNYAGISKQSSSKIAGFAERMAGYGVLFAGGYGIIRGLWSSALYLHRVMEETREGYASLTATGISIRGGFLGLREAMAKQGYTLDMLTKVVAANATLFSAMGADAFKTFADIGNELKKVTSISTRYAMTYLQVDEYLADYLEIERIRGNLRNRDTKTLAQASEKQLQIITEYSSVLGKARKDILKEIADLEREPMNLVRKNLLRSMGEAGELAIKRLNKLALSLSATVPNDELRKLFYDIAMARELEAKGKIGYSNELREREMWLRLSSPELSDQLNNIISAVGTFSDEQIAQAEAELVNTGANVHKFKYLGSLITGATIGLGRFSEFQAMIGDNAAKSSKFMDETVAQTRKHIEADQAESRKQSIVTDVLRRSEELWKNIRGLTQTFINKLMESDIFGRIIDVLDSGVVWLESKLPQVFDMMDYAFGKLDEWSKIVEEYSTYYYKSLKKFFTEVDEEGKTSFDKLVSSIGFIFDTICYVGGALETVFGKEGLFNTYILGFPTLIANQFDKMFGSLDTSTIENEVGAEQSAQIAAAVAEGEDVELVNPPMDTPNVEKLAKDMPELSGNMFKIEGSLKNIEKTMSNFPTLELDSAIQAQIDSSLRELGTMATETPASLETAPAAPVGPRRSVSPTQGPSSQSSPIGAVPHLAKGGVVTGDTLARIGEGTSPEVVMPLDPTITDLAEKIAISYTKHYGDFETNLFQKLVSSLVSDNKVIISDIIYGVLDKFFYSKNDGGSGFGDMIGSSKKDIMSILKMFGIDIEAGIWDRNSIVARTREAWGGYDNGGVQSNNSTTGGSSGPSGPGAGSSKNAEIAMKFFMDKGLTREQAAGLVGNLQAESGKDLDPNAGGYGAMSYGIGQWHRPRRADFKALYGKEMKGTSLLEQLEFVWHELNHKEKRAGDRLRAAKTVEDAAKAGVNYERPRNHSWDNPEQSLHYGKRKANAERLYKESVEADKKEKEAAKAKVDKTVKDAERGLANERREAEKATVSKPPVGDSLIQKNTPMSSIPLQNNIQAATLQTPVMTVEQLKDIVYNDTEDEEEGSTDNENSSTSEIERQIASLNETTKRLATLSRNMIKTMDSVKGSVTT